MARLRNITDTMTPAEFGALVNEGFIAIDEATLSAAHKLDLKGLILTTDDEIRAQSANGYYLVSPKALLELLADETDTGLVRLASVADIQGKSGNNVIAAGRMAIVLQEAEDSVFVGNGDYSQNFRSDDVPVLYSAMTTHWNCRDSDGMSSGQTKQMMLALGGGIGYDMLRISLAVRTNLGYYFGTKNILSSSSAVYSALSSTGTSIYVYPDGYVVMFQATSAITYLSCSAIVQATTKSV